MPVLTFDMSDKSDGARRYQFRGEDKSDYYEGELGFASDRVINMRIEKTLAGDYPIYKLVSQSGLTFRRAWSHIRRDKTDVTVFWFVRQGRVTISHSLGYHAIGKRECTITRSSMPFFMELMPDESGRMEILHAVVPTYKTQSILGASPNMGKPMPTMMGDLSMTEKMLSVLFEGEMDTDPEIAGEIAETLLTGLTKIVARHLGDPGPAPSIENRRVADVIRIVKQNFSNPDFCQEIAAKRCGISPRYLCHLLSKNDLSFSEILWEKRMQQAHDWLIDESMRHHPISEVAYMAGFKSSSHFSRMFKVQFGISQPRCRLS